MRFNAFRALAVAVALQAAALGIAACVDVTPVNPDVEAIDASIDAGACISCVHADDDAGLGCGDELAACDAVPVCKSAFACAETDACFETPSIQDFLQCGLRCNDQVGLQNDSAALKVAQSTVNCLFDRCGVACGWKMDTDASK